MGSDKGIGRGVCWCHVIIIAVHSLVVRIIRKIIKSEYKTTHLEQTTKHCFVVWRLLSLIHPIPSLSRLFIIAVVVPGSARVGRSG